MSKSITNKLNIETKISYLISYCRKELTTRAQLEKFPIGSLISYTNKNGTFKYGGYLVRVKKDWFVFMEPDFTKKVRVRFINIDKMWVGDVFKVVGDKISFKTPDKETKHPVYVANHIVFYGGRKEDAIRFMVTQKYKNMIKWYEYFHSD